MIKIERQFDHQYVTNISRKLHLKKLVPSFNNQIPTNPQQMGTAHALADSVANALIYVENGQTFESFSFTLQGNLEDKFMYFTTYCQPPNQDQCNIYCILAWERKPRLNEYLQIKTPTPRCKVLLDKLIL
jgi:hypothetical protein